MNTNSLINSILPISILLLPNCLLAKNPNKEIKDTKQNIIVIISDDLGFGHVSAYGSKSISTPDIDYLSNKGVCLNKAMPLQQHRLSAVCIHRRV